jgi:hypothetical protein
MKLTDTLQYVKSTRNTHVYEGDKIPALYIPKEHFDALGIQIVPKAVTVTLTDKEGE